MREVRLGSVRRPARVALPQAHHGSVDRRRLRGRAHPAGRVLRRLDGVIGPCSALAGALDRGLGAGDHGSGAAGRGRAGLRVDLGGGDGGAGGLAPDATSLARSRAPPRGRLGAHLARAPAGLFLVRGRGCGLSARNPPRQAVLDAARRLPGCNRSGRARQSPAVWLTDTLPFATRPGASRSGFPTHGAFAAATSGYMVALAAPGIAPARF